MDFSPYWEYIYRSAVNGGSVIQTDLGSRSRESGTQLPGIRSRDPSAGSMHNCTVHMSALIFNEDGPDVGECIPSRLGLAGVLYTGALCDELCTIVSCALSVRCSGLICTGPSCRRLQRPTVTPNRRHWPRWTTSASAVKSS